MADVQSVTLWKLCCWAYARQKAHVLLRRPGQRFEWAIAATGGMEDGPRPTVAWDAAMLHDAVCDVSGGQIDIADAIVWPAANQHRPELPDAAPRCYPVELTGRDRRQGRPGLTRQEPNPDDLRRAPYEMAPSRHQPRMERNGRAWFEGERVEVAIRTLGFEVGYRPLYERRGRRWHKVALEPIWCPIEYCPVRWEPDPGWYATALGTYAVWRESMMRLWDAMQDMELRDHRLEHEEIPEAPPMPIFEPIDSGELDVEIEKRDDIELRLFDPPMLVERRVRAVIDKVTA